MHSIGICVDVLLVLLIFVVFAIKSFAFQTWLAHRAADYLASEFNTEVSIDRVEIVFFDYVYIHGVYIADLHHDTLAYIPKVGCEISDFSLKEDFFSIERAELIKPTIKLRKYKGEKTWNYRFLEDYFSSDSEKDTTSTPTKVNINHIVLTDTKFYYENQNKPHSKYGVDFDYLCLQHLNGDFSGFHQRNDSTFVKINRLWLYDCSGFTLDTLSAQLTISPNNLVFDTLLIKTPGSHIRTDQLAFTFNDFEDFNFFEDKVKMKCIFHPSLVDMADIAFFAPELAGINRSVKLQAKVQGTVNDLRIKKLDLIVSESTRIKGNVNLIGVTDIENVFIAATLDEFTSNFEEIKAFELPPFDGTTFIELPNRVDRFGHFSGSANFTGTPTDFVAYGDVVSDIGTVKTDIRFYLDTLDKYYHYKGDLQTYNFRAGYFYDVPELGGIDLDVSIKAKGLTMDGLQAQINGSISRLDFNSYQYKGINLNGTLHHDYFQGNVKINEENLALIFDGTVNFASKEPVFNFTSTISKANLAILNLIPRDSSSSVSMRVIANAQGSNLDNFEGALRLYDVSYNENQVLYHLDTVELSATYVRDSIKNRKVKTIADKTLILNSEIAYAKIQGKYKFEDLGNAFVSVVSEVLPALFDNRSTKLKDEQEFVYEVDLKDLDYVMELFMPSIKVSKNIHLDGRFNSAQNIFRLKTSEIDQLVINGTIIKNLSLSAKNNGDYLKIISKSDRIVLTDTNNIQNFRFDGEMYQNRMATTIRWDNADSSSRGYITGDGIIKSHENFEFDINPSYFTINKKTWTLGLSSHLAMEGSSFMVNDFNIYNEKQSISVSGKISNNRNDMLNIDVCNFDVANLNPIIGTDQFKLKGTLNGNGFIADLYNKPFFASDIRLDSFYVNQDYLGEFKLVNLWDNEQKRIRTTGELSRKELRNIEFSGYFYTEREKDNIDYVVSLKETNLHFINAFLPDDISDLRGLATGDFTIKGSTKKPHVKGRLNLENGAIKVTMLNTEYYFGGKIIIEEDMIAFDNIPLSDIKGNLAVARGTFFHTNYENWNFDCNIDFKKFLCLNTTEEMNPLYYGRAYATGDINVFAANNNIELTVNAKTEKGTKIVMPLYGAEDQVIQDFVRFVKKDSTKNDSHKVDLDGLTMAFNFDVTPDAEVQIVFDKLAGDMMRGRGAGHLQLDIDRYGEFTMYGQYIIDQGDYLFTLMNVINKRFSVKKGSSLSWYGDPLAADIDLKAVYKVNTSLYEIMPVDVAEQYKKSSEVDCIMNLKHNLFKPDISFDIQVPRGNEDVKTSLAMIRSSEQELTRQFFSLMAINKFLPVTNSISNAANNAVTGGKATLSELVSSQMSNWLSQISDEFDIGLNYKPGDEISSDEIAVALSTQLFNDRLTLNTNLGVSKGNAANNNPNQLIGDFNVEYKINDDGTFRIRAFNESNEFDITRTSQSPYTQGVGVYYTEEFDKFGDLKIIKKLKKWFGRKPKKATTKPKAEQ